MANITYNDLTKLQKVVTLMYALFFSLQYNIDDMEGNIAKMLVSAKSIERGEYVDEARIPLDARFSSANFMDVYNIVVNKVRDLNLAKPTQMAAKALNQFDIIAREVKKEPDFNEVKMTEINIRYLEKAVLDVCTWSYFNDTPSCEKALGESLDKLINDKNRNGFEATTSDSAKVKYTKLAFNLICDAQANGEFVGIKKETPPAGFISEFLLNGKVSVLYDGHPMVMNYEKAIELGLSESREEYNVLTNEYYEFVIREKTNNTETSATANYLDSKEGR